MRPGNAISVKKTIFLPFCALRLAYVYICFVLLCHFCNLVFAQEIAQEAQQFYKQAVTTTDLDEKIRLLESAIQFSPQFVEARLELAKTFIATKQYRRAIAQLDTTLNYDRKNAYVWFQKGRAHANLAEHGAALKCFNRAIKLKDEIPEFYIYQGQVHYEMESLENALISFELALSIAEDLDQQAEAWYRKGQIYKAKDDIAKAVKSYQSAVRLKPEFQRAKACLTKLENQLKLEDWYQQAQEAHKLEDWKTAGEYFRKIIEIDDDFKDVSKKLTTIENKRKAQALVDSAQTLQQQSKFDEAIALVEKAMDYDAERKSELQAQINQLEKERSHYTIDKFKKADLQPQKEDTLLTTVQQPVILEAQAVSKTVKTVEKSKPDTKLTSHEEVDSQSALEQTKVPETIDKSGELSKLQKLWQMPSVKWIAASSLFILIVAFVVVFSKKKERTKTQIHKQTRAVSISTKEPLKTRRIPKDILKTELGRYRIEKQLSRGAMSYVYKAYDLKLDRPVALKAIRMETGMDEDEIKERISRFRREAKATAILSHPNIVSLYDYDEKDGVFYMTMEFVEGSSVQEMLDKNKYLEVDQAVEIVRQTCMALEYAHKHDIIHRDIKPSNIMMNKENMVKVLDFGIAKMLVSTKSQIDTLTGMRIGSPSYMSPEQIEAGQIDARTDIFALGVVFYEMLAGEKPFKIKAEDCLGRLFYLILNTEPPKLSSIRKGLSSRIDDIVAKMLAKDPAKRFQNAREIIDALSSLGGTV